MHSPLHPPYTLVGWLAKYIGYDPCDPWESHDCHQCGAMLSRWAWVRHRLVCAEIGGMG